MFDPNFGRFVLFWWVFIPNPMVKTQEPRPRRQARTVPGPHVGQVGNAPFFSWQHAKKCGK